MLGTVDLESLSDGHWLRRCPMDVVQVEKEFGWKATPLNDAVNEYMDYLNATM